MLNLPEQGYTPANYAKLVKITQLSNVAFCEKFNIPKGTFEKHKAGTRTMKWQDWQALLKTVKQYLTTEQYIMSKYITCVGGLRVNNFSFDIYENKDGSASIRANKLGYDLPTKTWLTYNSVEEAKDYINEVCGDLEGAQRALYFWEHSGIAEKIEEKNEDELTKVKLASMSDAQKEHYYSQKQYEVDEKFIKDNNYFL